MRESDLKIEETNQKKWKIPQKKSFEGFPNIFEKTGNASKNSILGKLLICLCSAS